MSIGNTTVVVSSFALTLWLSGSPSSADTIGLNNGGEVRGRIIDNAPGTDPQTLLLETLTGGHIQVRQNDIRSVTRRRLVLEEYETQKRRMPDTIDGHWEMAEWCRKRNLKDQRATQLKRIIELDPNHTRARYGLGHTKRNGEWMSPEEVEAHMLARGYVKYKGRYVTQDEKALMEQSRQAIAAEREWFGKVRSWHGWLSGTNPLRRQKGLEQLRSITDPHAIRALTQFLGKDSNKRIRLVYVDILGRLSPADSLGPLVRVALSDPESDVRTAAVNAFSEDQHPAASARFIIALKSDFNVIVRRAATALQQIGDANAVPALIDALVTTHRYRVRVPGSSSPTFSFSSDGAFSVGQPLPSLWLPPEIDLALRTGQLPFGVIVQPDPILQKHQQTKRILVTQDQQNHEVLWALQGITGRDWGFDKTAWRQWWRTEKNSKKKVPKLE